MFIVIHAGVPCKGLELVEKVLLAWMFGVHGEVCYQAYSDGSDVTSVTSVKVRVSKRLYFNLIKKIKMVENVKRFFLQIFPIVQSIAHIS